MSIRRIRVSSSMPRDKKNSRWVTNFDDPAATGRSTIKWLLLFLSSSASARRGRLLLLHGNRGQIRVAVQLLGLLHLRLTRGKNTHLSYLFVVSLYQPDLSGETVHLVGRIYRPVRWSHRIHSTEDERKNQDENRSTESP